MARHYRSLITAFLTLLLCVPAFASGRPYGPPKVELRYKLVELYRKLPDGQREPVFAGDLNDRGEVLVGGSLRETPTNDPTIDGYPEPRSFIWRNGRVTELVSPDPFFFDVESRSINNRGEVTGSLSRYDPGFGARVAFIWRQGRFTRLAGLPGSEGSVQQFAEGWSINDWGEVVGWTTDNDTNIFSTPYRWYRGKATRIPVPPELSATAVDINNWGQIVGNGLRNPYDVHMGPYGGFIADRKGNVQFFEPALGLERMSAVAINDRGQVIGGANDHALLWEDDTVLDLGTLPGGIATSASAINNAGTIVGSVRYPNDQFTAMIWRDGRMRDLNELIDDEALAAVVHLNAAADINNLGWITAGGTNASDPENVRLRSYLLIPVWRKRL